MRVPTVEEMRHILAGTKPEEVPVEQDGSGPKRVSRPVAPGVQKLRGQVEMLTEKIEDIRSGKKLTSAELRQGIEMLFQKHDFNPVEELIIMANQCEDLKDRIKICMFLTEFHIPKLKSIEVSGSIDHQHTVVIRRFGKDGQASDSPMPSKVTQSLSRGVTSVIDAEVVK